ncbi:SpoIID/LytB domain-containing protein [Candidatus Uabimicrobium sp. HlEnr_7]|uniref:SpoIID/LytB domain-containing protein n=1 Tax=Candidatus Uabimicrobium helgolandensis TaxID=3095367 RepID=UPI003557DF55
MRYFAILLIAMCSFLYADAVVSYAWEKDVAQSQIGPQAIVVDDNGIYVLCNFSQNVLLFSHQGTLVEQIPYKAEGCGLAVGPDGELAVFSPLTKTITWIRGELTGLTKTVDELPAVSEVWNENGSWWARCGWQVVAVDAQGMTTSLCQKSFVSEQKVIMQQGADVDLVFTFAENATNVKPIAHASAGTLYVDVLVDGQHQIFLCGSQAEMFKSNTIKSSQPSIFSHYYVYNNHLYQLFSTKNGFQITCKQMSKNTCSGVTTQRHQEQITPNETISATDAPTYIDVLFQNEGVVKRVKLQDYLKNVVSAEIYGSWSLEAHRAMAVTARTYAIGRKRHSNANVCTTTHCQAWKADVTSKATQGVNDTNGVLIYHKGRVISEALYFAHCNGKTRNSEEKWNYNPYLRSKNCACGKKSYYGHGVGACQYGLQAYSQQGWSYSRILEHYFTNSVVK